MFRSLRNILRRGYTWPLVSMVAYLSLLVAGLCKKDHGLSTAMQLRKSCVKLEQEIKVYERENGNLQHQWRALRDNPRSIEQIAREELHMYGDREMVFYFPAH